MLQCPERVFGERLQGLMARLGQGHDFTLNCCPSPQTISSGQPSRWTSFRGVCLEITIQQRWGGPPPLRAPFHLHCWESSSATRSGLSGCRGHMGSFAYRGQQTWANSTWPSLSPVRGWGGGGDLYKNVISPSRAEQDGRSLYACFMQCKSIFTSTWQQKTPTHC